MAEKTMTAHDWATRAAQLAVAADRIEQSDPFLADELNAMAGLAHARLYAVFASALDVAGTPWPEVRHKATRLARDLVKPAIETARSTPMPCQPYKPDDDDNDEARQKPGDDNDEKDGNGQ